MQHQLFGGIPRVHQDGAKWQFLVLDGIIEHLSNVVEFRFAVHVGGKQAIVDEPELVGLRIDINASDNADAFDNR